MHRGIREICVAFAAGLVATLLTFALFLLIQAASFWAPKEHIEDHLRTAFETGALDLYDLRPFDADLGYHQARDCLIYGMTILRPTDIETYVLAPRHGIDTSGRATSCEILRDSLYGEMSTDYAERPSLIFLHGYRAITAMVLSITGVPEMRGLFKAVGYFLLLATVALAARQLVLSLAGRDSVNPTRPIGSIAVAAAFSLFYGLTYFGQSPAHAPVAWVLFGFLLFATHCNLYRLSSPRFYASIAVFGAWIAFFEFFTGALLIGLCLLIGLLAIHAHKKIPTTEIINRSMLAPLVYLSAIWLCFALMLLLQRWQIDAEIIPGFVDALTHYAGHMLEAPNGTVIVLETDAITLFDIVDALIRKVGVLTSGDTQAGMVLVLMSLHLMIGAALLIAINGKKRRDALRISLCLMSVLPIVGWLLLFPQHSLTQSAYMVRVIVWLPAAAGLAITIAGEVCQARFRFRDYLGLRDANFRGRS